MAPWNPSGTWRRHYAEALEHAFPYVQDFDLVLDEYFDIATLQNIAPTGPGVTYRSQISQLVRKAQAQGWLADLVAAVQERRPNNAELREYAAEIGLTLTGMRMDNPTGRPFESIINEQAKLISLAGFLDGLAALQGQVCWLDFPGGGGTSFLIGSDLIVTNDHVIEPLLRPGWPQPEQVRCRFDYKEVYDGSALARKQVTEVALAGGDDWLVERRPKSKADEDHALGEPAEDELDYAILRLAEAIGEEPVGPATADNKAPPRGWIDTSFDPPQPPDGSQVFLLQHPLGEPLQIGIGEIKARNRNGTRLRYDANSKRGSSGSPCFNADLQLVALHHARDPENWPPQWNQAVPLDKIRAQSTVSFQSPPAGD